jgi:hypothetical protein
VLFLNQAAEELIGCPSSSMVGKSLQMIVNGKSFLKVKAYLQNDEMTNAPLFEMEVRKMNGNKTTIFATVKSLNIGEEKMHTIILNDTALPNPYSSKSLDGNDGLHGLFVNQDSQQRLQLKTIAMKEAMSEVGPILSNKNGLNNFHDLRYFGTEYENITDKLNSGKERNDIRKRIVEIMKSSLSYWESHENRTKVDLAEQSKIWTVYLDAGTYRTRTLDKYLNVKTLPNYPKWKDVIKTSLFVLTHTPPKEPYKKQVIDSLEQLKCLL